MQPVEFYKCLADDTRLRSLLLIQRQGELCVCELTEALQLSQPKISRHLAQLRQLGILTDRRQGQWVFYRLNSELPDWADSVLKNTADAHGDFIAANLQQLEQMGQRPERTANCC